MTANKGEAMKTLVNGWLGASMIRGYMGARNQFDLGDEDKDLSEEETVCNLCKKCGGCTRGFEAHFHCRQCSCLCGGTYSTSETEAVLRLRKALREVIDAGAALRYDEWGEINKFPEGHVVNDWDKARERAEAALAETCR